MRNSRGGLRNSLRVPFALLLVGLITACSDPNTTPMQIQFGDSKTLVMGGNLRMVTERERPMPGAGSLPTMCSEPSPDVAIAFGRSLAAQGSYAEPSGPSVSGSFNASSTETATQLAGRTAGVLALRDGLFAACQSYSNGVLGHDAYAIILSQYGNLLVALAGTGTAEVSLPSPQDTAVAALLVSCVSEYDPTRLAAVNPDKTFATNPMLSPRLCGALLANIASGKLLQVPKAAASKKTAATKSSATDKTTTIKTNTTKTISTTQ